MKRREDAASPTSPAPLSMAWLIAAGIVTVVVVACVFLGGDLPLAIGPLLSNGLIVVMWLLAAFGFGRIILRAIPVECGQILRVVIAIALGLGMTSLATLLLGCAGMLNRGSAIGILIVGSVIAIWFVRKSVSSPRAFLKRPAQWHWLWLGLLPLLSIALICALLPPGMLWGDEPNGYDVTEYHLQVPREWYEAGKIIPLHHNVFSYFTFNVETHYLLAMNLRGGPWAGMYLAQLMHVSFIVLAVIAIYALLVDKHPRGAIVAACIAGATPWLTLLAPIAYNEGGLLLFGTLAIGLAMRGFHVGCASAPTGGSGTAVLKHTLRGDTFRLMLLSGAMAGFACGSKLTAVPAILIPLPIIFGVLLRKKSEHRTSNIEHPTSNGAIQHSMLNVGCSMFAFYISALLAFSPWLIRNVIWAHNPVFPEATSVFGKSHWSDAQVERWKRANHQPRPDQQNLPGRSRALWVQVLADARYAYLLLPLGLCAAMLRRDRESAALFLLFIFNLIFWMFFTHLQSRFFVLAIPIAALLIGRVEIRAWEVTTSVLAIFVAIFGTFFLTWKIRSIENRLAPYQIRLFSLIGMPSLRDFSRLPLTDDGKTIELVGEGQAFLYDIPMKRLYYRTVFDVDAQPGESVEQAWRKGWPAGADVNVIRNDGELDRFHQTYYAIPAP